MTTPERTVADEFARFVADAGVSVRRALVARYGVDVGTEAAAAALAVAWERWAQIRIMDRPAGYVYRIGQSRARPHVRWRRRAVQFPGESATTADVNAEVLDLFAALRRLPARERTALVLVKSYGYSHRRVAELLGVPDTTVNNLVHRGLQRVRALLEVTE